VEEAKAVEQLAMIERLLEPGALGDKVLKT
jgi:hypothetical protein